MSDTNIYHLPCRNDFSSVNAVAADSTAWQFTHDEETILGDIARSHGGTFRKTAMPEEGERLEFFMTSFERGFQVPSLIVQKEPWSATTIGFRLVLVKENQVPESNDVGTVRNHFRRYLQSAHADAQPRLKVV